MTDQTSAPAAPDRLTRFLRWVVGAVVAVLLAAAAWYAYTWVITPEALRHPGQAHYHFRLQVINQGQPAGFSQSKYQTDFNKDVCSADLTKEPVHFHDNLDQFVHVHWKGITGGLLLKTYGWNLSGGPVTTLGYRFDNLPRLVRVPIHGAALPERADGTKYFVYTSTIANPTDYKQRDWDEFLKADLNSFLGKGSVGYGGGWLDWIVPRAQAHSGHEHTSEASTPELQKAQLNNVIGNVVIFAQSSEPTADQVKARFADLVPLPESACAG